ncbi:replication restart DNA helicase PriA [Pelagirhabdus alkalitolerans]|uniref:Replication restart protein PriA n=1 Tax=Pelagirhabdus alkalitolerans TaxID=1612202 RepID=A0A1G6H1M2_9BACI|nr:primosomal protein N' [Pelagirhabdus alkalitolerans]SDB88054.1 replication restart DNA helicase PriA [Pelagirhabdus alkalitolerans]
MKIAKVVVDVPASQTDKIFDYIIPEHLDSYIEVGMRVIVPFGPRTIMGYIIGMSDESNVKKLKPIKDLMDISPVLTPELIELGKWVADYTLSFYISAFQAMLPQALKATYHKSIERLADQFEDDQLNKLFDGRDEIDTQELLDVGFDMNRIKKAEDLGELKIVYHVGRKETYKKVSMIKRQMTEVEIDQYRAELSNRAKKRKEIVDYVAQLDEPITFKQLLNEMHTTRQTVQPLIQDGVVNIFEQEIYRNPNGNKQFEKTFPLPLADQQKQALTPIVDDLNRQRNNVYVLHGVTGSGKTEVYLQSIERAMQLGKEAIVLVPEISLTPQMVNRFKGRFGDEVAVMHSALSKGERFDEWRKVQNQEVKVVVGARSAIFAPFQNIGLIIIDEEHESSYKQEDHPRYHVKDVAIKRAETHMCPVILGSATPTLETYARAQKNVYQLLEMPDRMNQASMPEIHIADMREELHAGNRSMFSTMLVDKIRERIDRGEQVVLFLNRRGYSTFVMCRDCGEVKTCPHCAISLTYHQKHHLLKCHYCQHQEKMPSECPSCQSDSIRYFGTGTQKVEQAIEAVIPEAKVIRMDVDTTRRKGAHEKLLAQFQNKQANILLGTQMIAKGLDFPDVTLVGVLAADSLLNLPDFRSSERTFQLLTQVSGRAGRHELKGEVVIQTYSPEHYSIEYAKQYDYSGFFKKEMSLRKAFQYPPYFFMTLITVSHENPIRAEEVTRVITQLLEKHLSENSKLLGPTPSPLEKIKDRYRFQCMIKYKYEPEQKQVLKRILSYYEPMIQKEGLQIQIDLQPYQLM